MYSSARAFTPEQDRRTKEMAPLTRLGRGSDSCARCNQLGRACASCAPSVAGRLVDQQGQTIEQAAATLNTPPARIRALVDQEPIAGSSRSTALTASPSRELATSSRPGSRASPDSRDSRSRIAWASTRPTSTARSATRPPSMARCRPGWGSRPPAAQSVHRTNSTDADAQGPAQRHGPQGAVISRRWRKNQGELH